MHTAFQRHINACNNAALPGMRLAFHAGSAQVGWVMPDFAAALLEIEGIRQTPGGLFLDDAASLHALGRMMSKRGHYRDRREAFDVRAHPGGAVVATIDRGALPAFGVMAEGVHLNGLVHKVDGVHLWVARRAADKTLDPGKLDHLVAGGVSAGMTVLETLIKEAGEEAALPPDLAGMAIKTAQISYAMERAEGLRRDVLHCYDVVLPPDFMPIAADGEVESFALWPISRVFDAVRDTDDFKFNVNLVLIDLFRRLGMLPEI